MISVPKKRVVPSKYCEFAFVNGNSNYTAVEPLPDDVARIKTVNGFVNRLNRWITGVYNYILAVNSCWLFLYCGFTILQFHQQQVSVLLI